MMRANGQLSMSALNQRIAKSLHVNSDEAAILAILGKWRQVYFVYDVVGVAQLGTDSAVEHFCLRGTRQPAEHRQQFFGGIQISRKAANAAEAGPDFTTDDLGSVLALCKPLGKLIRHVIGISVHTSFTLVAI